LVRTPNGNDYGLDLLKLHYLQDHHGSIQPGVAGGPIHHQNKSSRGEAEAKHDRSQGHSHTHVNDHRRSHDHDHGHSHSHGHGHSHSHHHDHDHSHSHDHDHVASQAGSPSDRVDNQTPKKGLT
jgi:hypothetical protein